MIKFDKPVVLVGLMGTGKTRIGLELARLLGVPFLDSDQEIERAAGFSISEIFSRYGEEEFRKGEAKVIARLLDSGACVLASGGGAFIQPAVREVIKNKAISVWLKADIDVLVERTSRRNHRPLLEGQDKKETLQQMMDERYPIYATADITCVTDGLTPAAAARQLKEMLENLL